MSDSSDLYSSKVSDGVCFPAGLSGAVIGAGVIHAYLAADRKPPELVAGISAGALSAAAMQRAYLELDSAKRSRASDVEALRWAWLQRYLAFLTGRPLGFVWNCIPDPTDFLADLPPVKEAALPGSANERKNWERTEAEARRGLYLMAEAGGWIARLPIRVSYIARIIVQWVRFKERYGDTQPWSFLKLAFWSLSLTHRVILHTALHPRWVKLGHCAAGNARRSLGRPLFGWPVWLLSVVWCLMIPLCIVLLKVVAPGDWLPLLVIAAAILAFLLPVFVLIAESWARKIRQAMGLKTSGWLGWTIRQIGKHLSIERALLKDFYLNAQLHQLFQEEDLAPSKLGAEPMPALLVAAPLQLFSSQDPSAANAGKGERYPTQLWATTENKITVVEALRACLAVPGFFAPISYSNDALDVWVKKGAAAVVSRLDLVDGAVVRENPLPAVFSFLEDKGSGIGKKLSAGSLQRGPADPVLHLVYTMPIDRKPTPPLDGAGAQIEEPKPPDIIDAAKVGIRLNRRRDSRLEVIRTNLVSKLYLHSKSISAKSARPALSIFVDEIAPLDEFKPENPLQPTARETLERVSHACRRTLGALHPDLVNAYMVDVNSSKGMPCSELLSRVAHLRTMKSELPGLPEVCRHCTKLIEPVRAPDTNLLGPSFEQPDVLSRYEQLNGDNPRIVLVLSGGVFRGAFHLGLLGALLAVNVRPHLIAGASVGTLMGAAFGAMAAKRDHSDARAVLLDLVRIFAEVDQTVALTRPLKAAARDLGIRSRLIGLSPNELRKMVRKGSQGNPGTAATGAPPALIDALSDLFLIPYNQTREIAADFVSGKIARAIARFFSEVKRETIHRLGIADAVIGASLIEQQIRRLLENVDLGVAQPFDSIAFFATTVNLVTERIVLLGSDPKIEDRSYNFVQATLASSAFPSVFAPCRESDVYPGVGRRDFFFGDGGTFDNLPFMPAIQVLAAVQGNHYRDKHDAACFEFLNRRVEEPDLFLVGALNAKQEPDDVKTYDFLSEIVGRAFALADNEKIFGFVRSSQRIQRQLETVVKAGVAPSGKAKSFFNQVVNAAVLPVFPADSGHLNGTFQFCASVGLKRENIYRSAADGCFQTFKALQEAQHPAAHKAASDPLMRSVKALTRRRSLPEIVFAAGEHKFGDCRFFKTMSGDGASKPTAFQCPFYTEQAGHGQHIYRTCVSDPVHTSLNSAK
jgi:predicted acylesterase/phospholipase RssA